MSELFIESTWRDIIDLCPSPNNTLLYGNDAKVGAVIGTFSSVPYIHLQLEARKRFYPDIPLLVHDDASSKTDELKGLCSRYGCDFETNSYRQPHHLGDLTAFIGGLYWAKSKNLDLLVKISRRWIFLTDWVSNIKQLAIDSQYATFSNYTKTFNFGFRTECQGMHVDTWFNSRFIRQTKRHIELKKHVFVEAYIHNFAREFEQDNCIIAQKWKVEHQLPDDKNGYAQWDLIGTDRGKSDELKRWIWHDCDNPGKYYELSKLFGLNYNMEDFLDPNGGEGIGQQ